MKKITLLMAMLLTVLVGCKDEKKDAPLSEQILGKWNVTELYVTDKWVPAKDAGMNGVYIDFKADKSVVFNDGTLTENGTYVIVGKKITCTLGTDKMDIDITTISGNSAELVASYDGKTIRMRVKK